MAKAQKLPSGNYRVRVTDPDTAERKSFTAQSKREAELAALEWLNGKRIKVTGRKTVKEAVKEYIESKENLLSPSSVRGYYIILNNAISDIEHIDIHRLSEKQLQSWVNENSKRYKPKTVKSQFGLVTAALRQEHVNLDFKAVLLPRIPKSEKRIPTEDEIAVILHMIEGTSVELPVTIAVTLGLRQSEIAALRWSDYNGSTLKIHSARVPNKENKYILKDSTKSEASTREIEVDDLLKARLDRAERNGEFISPMLPSSVLRKFNHLCDKNGLPRFTMHEQRHGNASMMLAQGVPDKYAMKRLGQSTPSMVKEVYQHLYESKEKEVAETVSKAFSDIYGHKNGHE